MLAAIVIIAALGGLELVLWFFDYRQQRKQIDLLDSIWAELAIHNSTHEEQQSHSDDRRGQRESSAESAV